MAENNVEKWSTLKEVQEHLGVGRETILHWISLRGMPAYKVGRLWKFKTLRSGRLGPLWWCCRNSRRQKGRLSPFYGTANFVK